MEIRKKDEDNLKMKPLLGEEEEVSDPDYERFKQRVYQLAGICLDKYKERQMKRRLTSLMQLQGAKNFDDYYKLLVSDKNAYQKFLDRTTINVSEFFRNPEKFVYLQQSVIPQLYQEFHRLKIWSAGCSIGTEPYTLAMIMEELGISNFSILATDVDDKVLQQANAGLYTAEQTKNVSKELLAKYFEPQPGGVQVKSALKRHIKFGKHSLLEDRFETGFHLILCRNVVIYFTEEAKEMLYRAFTKSLVPGGVIFIGNTERIFKAAEMGLENFSTFFYRKRVEEGNS